MDNVWIYVTFINLRFRFLSSKVYSHELEVNFSKLAKILESYQKYRLLYV